MVTVDSFNFIMNATLRRNTKYFSFFANVWKDKKKTDFIVCLKSYINFCSLNVNETVDNVQHKMYSRGKWTENTVCR